VTFEKLQRERARQERQAEKRARRQSKGQDAVVEEPVADDREKTQEELDMELIRRLAAQ
jgi:hypothetical protein